MLGRAFRLSYWRVNHASLLAAAVEIAGLPPANLIRISAQRVGGGGERAEPSS